MDKEHMQIVIDVMTRVRDQGRAFDFKDWQSCDDEGFGFARTEQELRKCGSPACVGGWLAVSPEFAAAGGKVGIWGRPNYVGQDVRYSLPKFLDLPRPATWDLFSIRGVRGTLSIYGYLCGVEFSRRAEITPAHVVEAFTRLRDNPELVDNLARREYL